MKKILSRKKIWALGFGLWALAGNLAMSQEDSDLESKRLDNYYSLPQYIQSIRIGVVRIAKTHDLDADSILKIDFSYPGDPIHGDHPEFEVFNPNGGDRIPFSIVKKSYEHFAKDPRLVFTLGNRIENTGTDKPDLLVIVPDIYPKACKKIQEYSHQFNPESTASEVQHLDANLNMEPYPAQVGKEKVADLSYKLGCVQTPSGYYYYHILFER